ncbi:MAG TPA: T9SS type A sorting domain-containing protein, partial [Chryseosolibacter sp.]
MYKVPTLILFLLAGTLSYAQTCTVTGTSPLNWPTNGAGIVCSEGGNATGKTTLIIPAGFTVVFNDNGDTWTGTTIEVYGTLNVTASPTINSSIVVNNGGTLSISGKLALGSSSGCPYNLIVRSGGTVDVASTGTDRLTICGVEVMKGAGACNDCGGTNSGQCPYNGQPYCEPAGGFTGPTGFDQGGFNSTLPVKLLFFRTALDGEKVKLDWATAVEENFYKFVIQRSTDGLTFEEIGEVPGQGSNIYGIESQYAFVDEAPLSGLSYYRLKAVDLDESFEYFGVRAVKVIGSRKLVVYPNPSSGNAISFRTNFSPAESDRVILMDQLNSEVFNDLVSQTGSTIVLKNKLTAGIYMIRYVSRDFEQTARVVVRN